MTAPGAYIGVHFEEWHIADLPCVWVRGSLMKRLVMAGEKYVFDADTRLVNTDCASQNNLVCVCESTTVGISTITSYNLQWLNGPANVAMPCIFQYFARVRSECTLHTSAELLHQALDL